MATRLTIKKGYRLAPLTTFGVGGRARYFTEVQSEAQLCAALDWRARHKVPLHILGGGSNTVFADRGFPGLVVKMALRGFTVERESKSTAWVRVAAGEVWDHTVARFVRRGLWGAENLSLVPGSTGAAAIQNVEAYGHESKNTIASLRVYDRKDQKIKNLSNTQCHFRYRGSIFNAEEKGRYVVLSILFRLQKHGKPVVTYPDVIAFFAERKIAQPTLGQMRRAIIAIRTAKLPDPKRIGNAGSFFKTLYITEQQYQALHAKVAQHFSAAHMEKLERLKDRFLSELGVKVPTGFLLEALNFKGYRLGNAAIYKEHALIIVNVAGRATARDIMKLVRKVRLITHQKSGLWITPEPELVGFTAYERHHYFGLDAPQKEY